MSSSRNPNHNAPPSEIHPSQNNEGIPHRCTCGGIRYFPAGFRFSPGDDELIIYYLKNRVEKQPYPLHEIMSVKISEVDLYKCGPEELTVGRELERGEKFWYFVTARDRKYKNGKRPSRKAGAGFWKATGSDKPIRWNGKLIGYKKTLKYYRGKNPRNSTPTNWIMHEFRVPDESGDRPTGDDMRLKGLVLCKIYEKFGNKKDANEEQEEEDDQTANNNADPEENDGESPTNTLASDPQENNGESPTNTPASDPQIAVESASVVIAKEEVESGHFIPVNQTSNDDFSISYLNWDFLPDDQTNNLDIMAAAGSLDFQYPREESTPVNQTSTDDFSISDLNWDFLPDDQTNNLDFMAAAGSWDFQYPQDVKLQQVLAEPNVQNQDSGASSSRMICAICKTSPVSEEVRLTGSGYAMCNNCFIKSFDV